MVNKKINSVKGIFVRVPRPLYDWIVKLSAERTLKGENRVSVATIVVEAIEEKKSASSSARLN